MFFVSQLLSEIHIKHTLGNKRENVELTLSIVMQFKMAAGFGHLTILSI